VPGDTNNAPSLRLRPPGPDDHPGERGVQRNPGRQISYSPTISGDGTVVAFLSLAHNLVLGDTNGTDVADVFVRDLKAGTTVEVRAGGGSGSPGDAPAPPRRCRPTAGSSPSPAPHQPRTGRPRTRPSTSSSSTAPPGPSSGSASAPPAAGEPRQRAPSLSGDGRFVAFSSDATNLVPADTNQRTDVFVRDAGSGPRPG